FVSPATTATSPLSLHDALPIFGNFANEPDTLFRLDNARALLFSDVALAEGVAGPSRLPLTFGLFYFDYDLDGRLDCLTNNGHLRSEEHTSELQSLAYLVCRLLL